jgi:hypothetical protein
MVTLLAYGFSSICILGLVLVVDIILSELLTASLNKPHKKIMMVTAFWDIAPFSLFEVDLYFRGAYCPHQVLANVKSHKMLTVFINCENKNNGKCLSV